MPCVLRPAALSADCLAMPHLVHAVVSLTSGVLFFIVAILLVRRVRGLGSKQEHRWQQQPHQRAALALALKQCLPLRITLLMHTVQVLGDHELEPMSRSWLAAPHSMCELRSLLCKTVITISDILLKPWPHLQTVLYTITCGLIFYYHARMVSSGWYKTQRCCL